jgi:hypothetical protein
MDSSRIQIRHVLHLISSVRGVRVIHDWAVLSANNRVGYERSNEKNVLLKAMTQSKPLAIYL